MIPRVILITNRFNEQLLQKNNNMNISTLFTKLAFFFFSLSEGKKTERKKKMWISY